MRRSRLFQPGERIGIAVSGGPDSILLLDFAVDYAREAGLTVSAVHFNHRLRGADSDGDEDFVRARARQLGVEFHGAGAETTAVARGRKCNLEAVARDLRYAFFFRLIRQGKVDKVATAHTANDQAETVLLRLLRGAGTRGLGGIHPVLEGGIVRPFLMLTRAQVEAELNLRGLDFRVDASNRETRFARNRLRELVLPLLEREFNPQVIETLAGFADRARDDEAFIDQQARERAVPWVHREGGTLRIPVRRLGEFPPAVALRMLRNMVAEAVQRHGRAAGPVAISHTEMEDLRRLAAQGQGGKRLILGAGAEARKEFGWLAISRVDPSSRQDTPRRATGFAHPIRPPATIAIPELGFGLAFHFADEDEMDANQREGEYNKREAVWLGSSKLAAPLILRSWRAGDRFHALGKLKPVKLKEMFQRRRIPVAERPWWPVLESAGVILWVRGFGSVGAIGRQNARELIIREKHIGGQGK